MRLAAGTAPRPPCRRSVPASGCQPQLSLNESTRNSPRPDSAAKSSESPRDRAVLAGVAHRAHQSRGPPHQVQPYGRPGSPVCGAVRGQRVPQRVGDQLGDHEADVVEAVAELPLVERSAGELPRLAAPLRSGRAAHRKRRRTRPRDRAAEAPAVTARAWSIHSSPCEALPGFAVVAMQRCARGPWFRMRRADARADARAAARIGPTRTASWPFLPPSSPYFFPFLPLRVSACAALASFRFCNRTSTARSVLVADFGPWKTVGEAGRT